MTVEDDVLAIKAESSQETEKEQAGYLVREHLYGSFYRAIRLPDSVRYSKKYQSVYEHGVLTIDLPKAEEKKKKLIKVSVKEPPKAIEAPEAKRSNRKIRRERFEKTPFFCELVVSLLFFFVMPQAILKRDVPGPHQKK